MYLLNPTTLESKQLPVLPSMRSKNKNIIAYMFGFGYDSLSDDYAVVSISYWPCNSIKVARVYIYMLKKNYWDKVGQPERRWCWNVRGRTSSLNLVEMDNGQSFLVVSNAEEAQLYNCIKVSISQSITGMVYVESLVSPNNKEAHQKKKRRRSNTTK
ncbi:hypothetical protein POM88_043249 [Heracleum sosnowskyi]|uniref:Uncharacterized protein n=1 Tax=Heracleum sosnowskyi TaxID=360622 RepID=A0AAD8H0Q7_9APIA|nr:hypothetical protein POM88_043249 [Heracleum sosnowskyi]